MPLNQLLHDEQLIMKRSAGAKDWREAEGFRNQLAVLDAKISAYPLRNRRAASKPIAGAVKGPDQSVTLPVEIPPILLAAVDRWAAVWAVSRTEAITRLIDRGAGQTSHLMRSS